MKNKILVFDDIIDLEYQKKIKKILLSDCQYKGYEFPWYFTQDVTSHTDTNSQKRSAFYHGYVVSDDDTIAEPDVSVSTTSGLVLPSVSLFSSLSSPSSLSFLPSSVSLSSF